ncbi:ribonuclease Z [Actinomadura coerulea]|uniref:Ribonuclease Z n=1 Tax=Actinomadura coerulea TaxID=46159 RepID=A0A7X0G6I7_9ACTN|nr:ribonuclease Z [Actinomadura coerulea]MBB6400109.1 ribonuclease Z [Actinomadura coerulea]GGQ22098.1 ribonuclease Z [Actinomadura coerulea]
MSVRDLTVLGSASAVPTRSRNHNGYLLRWDGHGVLFDPGEGTQRQMTHAGLSANDVTWICVTHFHGDHCLGVPGIVQRIARDGVAHPVDAAFPASGRPYWERLRHATAFRDTDVIRERPVSGERMELDTGDAPFTLVARRLSHPVEAYGYRLEEPDGVTMLPDELAARGVRGPLIRSLQEEGRVTTPAGGTVTLAECSVTRPGQKVAFVMDTRLCDGVRELAAGVDMLVIESTFLGEDAALAAEYGHLTAAQAGAVAAEAGVGRLVLTHFSERYPAADEHRFADEAAAAFGGDITLVRDLDRIPLPPRRLT